MLDINYHNKPLKVVGIHVLRSYFNGEVDIW